MEVLTRFDFLRGVVVQTKTQLKGSTMPTETKSRRAAVLSTVATVTALVCSSAATADQFTLSERQLDKVTAAGEVNFNTQVVKTVNLNKTVNLTVNKNVTATATVTGNLATAEASADSAGFLNNLAETDTFAQVQFGAGAFSFSESLAAGNGTP